MEKVLVVNLIIIVIIMLICLSNIVTKKLNLSVLIGLKPTINDAFYFLTVVAIGFIGFGVLLLLNIEFEFVSIIKKNSIFESIYKIPKELSTAFIEEFLLRGLVFVGLLQLINNKNFALIISSLLFSLLHISDNPIVGFISYFIAGLMYGIALLRFKSIWIPIGLHFSWNYFQGVIFGFPIGGLINDSYLLLNIKENIFFNGGTSGPEESYIGIILRLLILVFIFILSSYFKPSFDKRERFLKFQAS